MPDNTHLVIALAASQSPGCQQALGTLQLPQLERLLARLTLTHTDDGEETDFSPPHERALARHFGLPASPEGTTPWAAWERGRALQPDAAWAFITPCRWQAGADHVTMANPADLALPEAESRELLALLAPWFEHDGIALHYDQPTRWLARGAALEGLATASLDRVTARDVRPWMPDASRAQALHRLHSEMQMLLYTHPFNDRRAARGLPPVNAFWLHGAGILPSAPATAPSPDMPLALRDAALREDWPAWADAWRQLDAGPIARLGAHVAAGGQARLTLCGERSARQWDTAPRGLLRRVGSLFQRFPLSSLGQQL